MNTKNTLTHKQAQKKKKILQGAAESFAEKGISETTLKDIARKVGVAKSTLYYYFQSKEQILPEIADYSLKQIRKQIVELLEENKKQKNQFALNLYQKLKKHPEIAALYYEMKIYAIRKNSINIIEKYKSEFAKWALMFSQNRTSNFIANDNLPSEKNKRSLIASILIEGILQNSMLNIELPLEVINELLQNLINEE